MTSRADTAGSIAYGLRRNQGGWRAGTVPQHQFGLERRLGDRHAIVDERGDHAVGVELEAGGFGLVPALGHDLVVSLLALLLQRDAHLLGAILYYLDDVFPQPPLMPKEPLARHRVRMYNKLIDEYLHNS